MPEKINLTDEEWRKRLGPDAFHICREQGTEAPFTGKYWDLHEEGRFLCAACGQELFDSQTKFDSGSGWPSFWAPASEEHVETHEDRGHGMTRTEVRCSRCGSHLGHIFPDGPQPTGLRYCINSASLKFEKK
ncbi:MAG TPA: peptide-methionine (R)-S-oxide reductase MsrB [Bryobacteraceae bacterium]|nr:peptide-methionine (R)-S-oxide reductase MsrB [Bryobacteraceae bacterium]